MKSADMVDSAYIFNDLNGLNSLKAKARQDQDAGLREVAKQFESMFMSMMLKSMREANDVMFEDNMLNTNESRFYRQMYDDQLALHLSQDKSGTGLAEILYKQLKEQLPENQKFFLENEPNIKPIDEMVRPIVPVVGRPDRYMDQDGQKEIANELSKTANDTETGETSERKVAYFDTPEQFVQQLLPYAENISRSTGLDTKTLIAQAALETGWGKHIMKDDQGENSFNLFGIKAHRDWTGSVATVDTLEHDGEQFRKEKASFRSYDSYKQSFQDYLSFLQSHPRYSTALRKGSDGEAYAEALQTAGYATDPEYAEKIQRIANSPMLLNALEQQAG